MKRFLLLVLLSGCRHSAVVEQRPLPVSVAEVGVFVRRPAGQRLPRFTPAPHVPCVLEPLYFEFDSDQLNDLAKPYLVELAGCPDSASASITLAGHADERGTEEYNLQLSQRRADVVKRYLEALGMKAKLTAVGYGEVKPANPAHNELAWEQNRRVELIK